MDLERTAVVIRPRTPWEAVDLGFRMARSWWRSLLGPSLLVAAPVWALAFLVFHRRVVLAVALVWWLRPLFDRVALFVLSRAVFGAPPTLRETVRALPGVLRGDLVGALVFRRFDLARAYHLPVWQLEGVSRERRRERFRVLDREGRGQAARLTFACFLMELCLLLGFLGLVALMIPNQGLTEVTAAAGAGLGGESPLGLAVLVAAAFAAHMLMEPCYVAAGFSLYLSARTRLEGWDVELGLRRLAARLARARTGRHGIATAGAVVVALVASGALPAAVPVAATPGNQETVGLEPPDVAVQKVLDDPDFDTHREVTTWHLRDWASDLGLPPSAPRLPRFAGLGRIVTIAVAAAILAWVLWQLVQTVRGGWWRRVAVTGELAVDALPETVHGRAQVHERLPGDVVGAARSLWDQGLGVEALGLLYRGALDRLVRHGLAPVDESWTEAEVLQEVDRRLPSDGRRYLHELTGTWTAAAYGHRLPGEERVRALCEGWSRHLEEAG